MQTSGVVSDITTLYRRSGALRSEADFGWRREGRAREQSPPSRNGGAYRRLAADRLSFSATKIGAHLRLR